MLQLVFCLKNLHVYISIKCNKKKPGMYWWQSLRLVNYSSALSTYPFPQVLQQDVRSSAEMWVFSFPWDLIQIRSDMASTAPKACDKEIYSCFTSLTLYDHVNSVCQSRDLFLKWVPMKPTLSDSSSGGFYILYKCYFNNKKCNCLHSSYTSTRYLTILVCYFKNSCQNQFKFIYVHFSFIFFFRFPVDLCS